MRNNLKIISILLSFAVLVLSLSAVSFAANESGSANTERDSVLLGDVDGDGKISTADARAVLRMAGMIQEPNLAVADMNGDGMISVDDAIAVLVAASQTSGGGVEIPDKNGDNFLSDKPNNEFIRLISTTYKVDSGSLVAIYSVPDSGTNYVLQFKNSRCDKSPANLEKVYHIGVAPERKISYTNGKALLGDHYNCEAAEGIMTFNLIKTKVMQQYPDYFVGV